MRVAQIVESLGMGGAENLAVRIANALAGRGHESHLIVMEEPGPLSPRIAASVRVHYLNYHRVSITNPIAFLISAWQGFRRVSGLLRSQDIHLLQSHLPGANFWGLSLQLLGVTRTLVTIHNNQEFRYGEDQRLRAWLRRRAYGLMLRRCAGVVTVSAAVGESLLAELGSGPDAGGNLHVVTNGVDVPEPLAAADRTRVRASLGIPAGVPLLLSAGRLSAQKNFGDLIKAAALLKKQEFAYRLVIAGEGEQHAQLTAQIRQLDLEDRVTLAGNLANLDQIMLASDLFTMSSLWEGLPLVLLEAMASGLAAVGYAIKGIDEVIEDGVTGLTVPVADTSALAAGLAGLLSDPARRIAQGQAGRERVRESYNFQSLVDNLETVYEAVSG